MMSIAAVITAIDMISKGVQIVGGSIALYEALKKGLIKSGLADGSLIKRLKTERHPTKLGAIVLESIFDKKTGLEIMNSAQQLKEMLT